MAWSYFDFVREIRASGLPATDRLVLLALALRADQVGECYPSLPTLAEDTGLHRATVQRSVQRLLTGPMVSAQERQGLTYTYRLEGGRTERRGWSQPATSSTVLPVAQSDGGGRTERRVPVAQSDGGGRTERHDLPTDPPTDLPSEGQAATPAQDSNRTSPAGPVCEGCDDAKVTKPGELCPACVAVEQELPARHQAGQPPAPPGSFARPDPSPKIAERIRSHRIFARLNADHLAETHAHHVETGGKELAWVLTAIDECADAANAAAAAPDEAWPEGRKADRISRYIRQAKRPKDPEQGEPGRGRLKDPRFKPPPGPLVSPEVMRATAEKLKRMPKLRVPDLAEMRRERLAAVKKVAGGDKP